MTLAVLMTLTDEIVIHNDSFFSSFQVEKELSSTRTGINSCVKDNSSRLC